MSKSLVLITIGSNHFGIAGWYGIRAMEQGLIVKYFLNTSILYCFSFENEFSDRNILVIMTFLYREWLLQIPPHC